MGAPETAAEPKRHGAMLRVGGSILRELLRLPPHWKVQRIVAPAIPEYDDAITLVVTGDGLPEAHIGQFLTELVATYGVKQ